MNGNASVWGPRVVLVEDDAEDRRLLRALLTDDGILVVGEAADADDGIARALALQPDVVLMDLRMPVVAGMGAARLIKEALPTTQVIVLTLYDGPLLARRARGAGVYACLAKGCSSLVIRDTIFQAWRHKLGLEAHGRALRRTPRPPG